MKPLFVLTACMLMSGALMAQQNNGQTVTETTEKIRIQVDEGIEKMSQGYNRCLKVLIPETQVKEVEKGFVKFMKDYNPKITEKKGEYFYDNAMIKQFGNNPVDVYSTATQIDKGVILTVFFDLGGAYLNSRDHGGQFEFAEKMIHDFAKEQTSGAVAVQIAGADALLRTKMKEQEELVKQDTMLNRKIRECQQVITDSQATLVTNKEQQDTKKNEIVDQQLMIEGLKAKQAGIE